MGTTSGICDIEFQEKLKALAKAAQERASKISERPEHLREERIKALQQKPSLTHGEQLELLFLLQKKWQDS